MFVRPPSCNVFEILPDPPLILRIGEYEEMRYEVICPQMFILSKKCSVSQFFIMEFPIERVIRELYDNCENFRKKISNGKEFLKNPWFLGVFTLFLI